MAYFGDRPKAPTKFVMPKRPWPKTRKEREEFKKETARLKELHKDIIEENRRRRRAQKTYARYQRSLTEKRGPCDVARSRRWFHQNSAMFSKEEHEIIDWLLDGKTLTDVALMKGCRALSVWSKRNFILMRVSTKMKREEFVKRWWFPLLEVIDLRQWDKDNEARHQEDEVHRRSQAGTSGRDQETGAHAGEEGSGDSPSVRRVRKQVPPHRLSPPEEGLVGEVIKVQVLRRKRPEGLEGQQEKEGKGPSQGDGVGKFVVRIRKRP